MEGIGIRRRITARLIKVAVTVASEVGTFYRRQSQVIKGERGSVGADVATAIEDSLIKLSRGKLLSEQDTLAAIRDSRRGKSGAVSRAVRVNFALKELNVSFVDAAPAEVCVLTVRSMRAAARIGRGADTVINVKVEHVQLDNHNPGSPYPVAFQSRCKPGALALDIVAVASADGGGVKIVKVIDVTFPAGVDVKLDISFLVRVQRMLRSMLSKVRVCEKRSDELKGCVPHCRF